MSESLQRGDQSQLAGAEIDKAHELANTLTLNRLKSKLKSDPTADLALALKQQANSYPQLRGTLAHAAQKKVAARGQQPQAAQQTEQRQPEGSTTGTSPRDAQWQDFVVEPPIQITHDLDQSVVRLVGLNDDSCCRPGADPHIVGELAAGMNKAIKNGQVLWALHGTVVIGLGESVVVKIGSSLDPDEVENLRYVNTRAPAVPAPSYLGCLTARQKTCVFMSRADGVTLESLWPGLSTEHKISIRNQLNEIFRALRDGPHAQDVYQGDKPRFGGFTSAICKDMRRQQRLSERAIETEAQFNDFLCHQPGRSATAWITMIRSAMRDDHRLVMTHGDLHPRNIMVKWEVDGRGSAPDQTESKIRVTALLDWELSGWYPEHWEFVKALSTIKAHGKLSDWLEYLPTDAIGSWPVEYSIDTLLDRWLG
ncbi:kinase-like domain-containing protein [Triangularia setosa]|uniref:Kinase-like domain-containing protein n=1 Tax=Triangularia setosa TaxID=2587417 RepID=A0AAN7A1J7_9PEZI|nr:kinase-like domain-containing protein [Podospora setosa]